MPSALVIRSNSSLHHTYAPYPTAETTQDYWEASYSAVTYAEAGTNPNGPFAAQDETNHSAYATRPYYQSPPTDHQIVPTLSQDVQPTNYDMAFPSQSAATNFDNHSGIEDVHYFGSSNFAYHQSEQVSHYPAFTSSTQALSHRHSESHSSSPSSAYTTQPTQYSEEFTQTIQCNDEYQRDAVPFGSSPTRIQVYPDDTRFYTSPPYPIHDEHPSAYGFASRDETSIYQTTGQHNNGYPHLEDGLNHQTSFSPPTGPTLALNTSPTDESHRDHSLSPTPYESTYGLPQESSNPVGFEPNEPASTMRDSSPPSETDSRELIIHQLSDGTDVQYQQSEQQEAADQVSRRTRSKSASVSSRWRKPDPSEESEDDSESAASPTTNAEEPAHDTKRLASLLHQVRMLGGDPMQAWDSASEGEDLDLKTARLLIASLQRDLRESREKVIEVQADLHRLRQTVENTSRSQHLITNTSGRAPLSAAPKIIYMRRRK
ncbi:hypothetical protein RhiJN_19151 [Ceratobasidium sp. AG-Ba]|nr:hypothetical protein RhiJN_19151 [Ceratobasidium sp. AG-Ba]